jgi:endonuclease/exonuclease/phosphatase family metal-dependent hydrolase
MKLISINIELDRRLDSVEEFLKKEQPDVVCLQEVFQHDLLDLEKKLGMTGVYASMGKYCVEPQKGCLDLGVGILSKLPLEDVQRAYYSGDEASVDQVRIEGPNDAQRYYHVFVYGETQGITIGTTHFTWTPNGKADDVQREHLKELLKILSGIPEIMFCGDFNAPRGGEIFDALAQRYQDNIPKQYTTSINSDMHRKGEKLRGRSLMVDGLFSTPSYAIQNVKLVGGVSDHMAMVAEVQK